MGASCVVCSGVMWVLFFCSSSFHFRVHPRADFVVDVSPRCPLPKGRPSTGARAGIDTHRPRTTRCGLGRCAVVRTRAAAFGTTCEGRFYSRSNLVNVQRSPGMGWVRVAMKPSDELLRRSETHQLLRSHSIGSNLAIVSCRYRWNTSRFRIRISVIRVLIT